MRMITLVKPRTNRQDISLFTSRLFKAMLSLMHTSNILFEHCVWYCHRTRCSSISGKNVEWLLKHHWATAETQGNVQRLCKCSMITPWSIIDVPPLINFQKTFQLGHSYSSTTPPAYQFFRFFQAPCYSNPPFIRDHQGVVWSGSNLTEQNWKMWTHALDILYSAWKSSNV